MISLEQKDSITAKLIALSKGGIVFNEAVKQFQSVYGSGDLPPNQLEALSHLFDSSVVTPLLSILQDFGVIQNAPDIVQAIELVRTAVLTIAGVFGKTSLKLNINSRGLLRYG